VEYSGSPRPVQFDARWKAREGSSLERLIPQGERNCRNHPACMTSTRDFSFVKFTSNSASRARPPNLQVLERVKNLEVPRMATRQSVLVKVQQGELAL
jgi:hypothetical protein